MMQPKVRSLAEWAAACGFAASLSLAGLAQPPAVPSAPPDRSGIGAPQGSRTLPGQMNPLGSQPQPEVGANGAMRDRDGFGTFGVIGSMSPESIGVQGPVPGIPIRQLPVKDDAPVFALKPLKLADVTEPSYATVHGNVTQSGTGINPAFITFDSKTQTGTPDVSGPGFYTGMVTIKDGIPMLHSGNKDYRLYTNEGTPIYRSSAASRSDLKKGTNIFVSRKHAADGSWGDYNSVYVLPEGPLPSIQVEHKPVTVAPAPAEKGATTGAQGPFGQRSPSDNAPSGGTGAGASTGGAANGSASTGSGGASANGGSPSPAK